jgi:hypothetical protein
MLFRVLISRRLGGPEILSAFIVFAAVLVLLPVMLFLSAKTEERVLTISPAGISTTIGKKSGQIPWNAVRVIIDGGTFVLIARNNGNAFFIPNRAFSGPTDRSRFLQQLASWRSILS